MKNFKVCIICFNYPASSETFIENHVKGLNSDLIVEKLNLEKLLNSKSDRRYFAINKPFIKNANNAIGRVVQFVARRILGIQGYLCPSESAIILKKYLENIKPDVLLVEWGHLAVSLLPIIKEQNLPLVPYFHGMDLSICWENRYYRKQLIDLLQYSKNIIVVNKKIQASKLIGIGCPKDKIWCIPCGAQVEKIKVSKNIQNKDIKFITVSRLVKKKGPLFTLRAFGETVKYHPQATLTMIGEGPLFSKCKKYIRKNNLLYNVRLLGAKPHNETLIELSNSNIFLQHSITSITGDQEGWGVSIAEAQCAGLPVVSTKSGGIPENVIHKKTGFLVIERDWKKMSYYMLKLADDQKLRDKLGKNGREHILKNGNAKLQLRKLKSVLEISL